MMEALRARVRRMRETALVRAWEYRQRDSSKGVWFRLRRVFVDAATAWVIDEAEADLLESGGRTPLPVGRELDPSKRLFFLTDKELHALSTRRQIPVRLGAELLQARSVVLTAFPLIEKKAQ